MAVAATGRGGWEVPAGAKNPADNVTKYKGLRDFQDQLTTGQCKGGAART